MLSKLHVCEFGFLISAQMHTNPQSGCEMRIKGNRNTNVIINGFCLSVQRFLSRFSRQLTAFAIYSHLHRILLVFFSVLVLGPVLFKADLLEQHRRFVYAFTQPRDAFHKRFPDGGTCSLFACTTSRETAGITIGVQSLLITIVMMFNVDRYLKRSLRLAYTTFRRFICAAQSSKNVFAFKEFQRLEKSPKFGRFIGQITCARLQLSLIHSFPEPDATDL